MKYKESCLKRTSKFTNTNDKDFLAKKFMKVYKENNDTSFNDISSINSSVNDFDKNCIIPISSHTKGFFFF